MENFWKQLPETKVIAALKSSIRTYGAKHPPHKRLSEIYKSEALNYNFEDIQDRLIGIIVYHYDKVWTLLIDGNCEILQSMLEDNTLDIRILNEYPGIPKALCGNKRIISCSKGEICREKSGNSMQYFMWTISSILRKLLGYEYCSMGRLQKVLWGLQAVSFHFSSYFLTERKVQCRLKCLAILYDFISEPYITSAEVGNVAKYLEEKYGWINAKRVREDFEKYFPESKLAYQPRSLQHLCRCTIQQSLRDSGKYPHETTGLPLPRILQKYVAPRKLSDF